jgi:hypothetical protein
MRLKACLASRSPRGEPTVRRKMVLTLIAAWAASLSMAVSAQTTDAEQDAKVYAAPPSRSIAMPTAQDLAGTGAGTASLGPTNVLEDSPRDTRGRPGGACSFDPVEGQLPAACRRQLEIARSL